MLKIKLFLLLAIFSASSFAVFSQTEDWRQYSSMMAGFAIKYPSDWRAKEEGFGRVLHAWFISPGVKDYDVIRTSGIVICTQPKGHISTVSDSRSSCRQRDDHLSDSSKDKVVSEKTVEINGLKIRKKITEDRFGDATYIYAFFSTKDRDVLISSSFPKRFNLDKHIPVFDQMLSTLQLLEKNTILTYRNEKYGFSISYSASWRSCPLDDYYKKKENILILVPEDGGGCFGGNFISILTVPEFSNVTKLPDLKVLLRKQNYSVIIPNSELDNIQTISGERAKGKYLYLQRYFYIGKSDTYNLLQISEMYDKDQEKFQQEIQEILATIKKL